MSLKIGRALYQARHCQSWSYKNMHFSFITHNSWSCIRGAQLRNEMGSGSSFPEIKHMITDGSSTYYWY